MTRAFSSPRHLIAQRVPDGALWSLREASSRCLLRFHIHVSAGLVFASGSTALIAGSAAPGSRPGRHRLAAVGEWQLGLLPVLAAALRTKGKLLS